MPIYHVQVDEHAIDHVTYEVAAKNADHAVELIEEGEGREIERTDGGDEFDVRFAKDIDTGAEVTY